MKLSFRAFSLAFCAAALLAIALPAHADNIITGSVWINQAPYVNLTTPLAPPVGAAAATFDVNGINFNSSNTSNGYTVEGFLTSGGNTVSNFNILNGNPNLGSTTENNTIYEFSGTTYLTAGTSYSVTHDDGVYLYLDGSTVNVLPSDSGFPTSADTETFSVATSGDYSFMFEYTEINGAPGVLEAPFAAVPAQTPEPSSFILFGSGLLAAAGVLRRRMSVQASLPAVL
jgi:PEP-CTERM motif